MKQRTYFLTVLLITSSILYAQKGEVDKYLSITPSEIKCSAAVVQDYDVVVKWRTSDPISDKQFNCNAVKAKYSAGLDSNQVRWNDVYLSNIKNFKQEIVDGIRLDAFNDFIYEPNDFIHEPNIFSFSNEEFYKKIPSEQKELAAWFILDAIQMHGLTDIFFDSLAFNQPLYPTLLDTFILSVNKEMSFKSKSVKLLWSGISKINQETCAIVKFESLKCPIEMDNNGYSFKGRSLYWGEIWISLRDKQFEHAVMVEDVVMKMYNSSSSEGQLIELQREIVFNKLIDKFEQDEE